jgi:hypothetical protein
MIGLSDMIKHRKLADARDDGISPSLFFPVIWPTARDVRRSAKPFS